MHVKGVLIATLALAAACGGRAAKPPPMIVAAPAATVSADAGAPGAIDPLGLRPVLQTPTPFTPPVPVSYKLSNGMAVWLLERHALPIVSMQIVIRAGAASDPENRGGVAFATANMLDEGAGSRGALDIARDVDRLGASLVTGAYADYSFVQLTSLKKNLSPASLIFGDVVVKPTFSEVEWKRVHDLWSNELRARQSEPHAVAAVVAQTALYGARHPYGHPTSGTLKAAKKVTLADITKFYREWWLPEEATCVVVGDITRAELDPLLDKALAGWKPRATNVSKARADVEPPKDRRIIVVDRADAPQSVISVVRQGVRAGDANAPPLVRVNSALGGSFTSRLNQDLREEHGWSYGAHSRFSFSKYEGMFAADAAVQTEHTGDALKAMLADMEDFARDGLTDEEVEKTKMLARADLIEAYESVEAAAKRIGRIAGVGLPPDHDANASLRMYSAGKKDLSALARQYVDVANAIVVIVGPRAKIEPQLKAIGITSMQAVGPEGE
ncbi:MAG: insulinase family protein [Polyangiaceae bacterium]|nr:insulinase family protein [Polyangiaceae bacterium]